MPSERSRFAMRRLRSRRVACISASQSRKPSAGGPFRNSRADERTCREILVESSMPHTRSSPFSRALRQRGVIAGQRVVVGDAQRLQTERHGCVDQFGRAVCAVGFVSVRV